MEFIKPVSPSFAGSKSFKETTVPFLLHLPNPILGVTDAKGLLFLYLVFLMKSKVLGEVFSMVNFTLSY